MAATSEMVGRKYGKVTVTGIDHERKSKSRNTYVIGICDCGETVVVKSDNLKSGNTKSCGCANFSRRTHGDSKTRLYNTWRNMRQRCSDAQAINYHNYGGRGIKVCNEWSDFLAFKAWALSHGYRNDLTIDRIDPNGNYEPSNCRWATWTEQRRNQRPHKKRS